MLRFRSAEPPFSETAVAGQAVRLLALIEALGLWEPAQLIEVLDGDVFAAALSSTAAAGVAPSAIFDWQGYSDKAPEEFARWISTVRDDLAASPVPERELPKLDLLFSTDRLAKAVGVADSSLRRYLAGGRHVPDEVANRAHLLARIVGDLAGSYNERGIRRWFERARAQLDDRAPQDILTGPWSPDDPDVARVAALAAERAG